MSVSVLVCRYAAFAVVATLANLAMQRVVLSLDSSGRGFALAVAAGTAVGLLIKYLLDKRWIFNDVSSGLLTHGRKFTLYTVMGIITTGIFWGTETGFWLLWKTDVMRELGAILGLSIGYLVKYKLDRRYVFTDFSAGSEDHRVILSGWGQYPRVDCRVSRPQTVPELSRIVAEGSAIARGNGRAYGDSAVNAARTIDMRGFHHLHAFDSTTGTLVAGAGVQLRDIVATFLPRGWFLPVTPGTSYVTVGGAIASDVHGKNHHVAGTFCQHVKAITMMLGTGDVTTTSPAEEPDLFHATCGGMGLTGIILSATIALIPVKSGMIRQTAKRAGSLEETCQAFESNASSLYSVAWVDCLARGSSLGRSVLFLGEHDEDAQLGPKARNASPFR